MKKLEKVVGVVVYWMLTLPACKPIIGGEFAKVNDHPYTVALRDVKQFCAGSIIDDRHVLTACHCIHGLKKEQMTVIAGSSLRRSAGKNGQSHDVEVMKCHPQFSLHPNRHDIALIRIVDKFKYSPIVAPIKLPTHDVIDGIEVVLAGWGFINNLGLQPVVLQKLRQHIFGTDGCINYYPVTPNHVCTYAAIGKGHCRGDSGGPVVSTVDGISTLIGVIAMSPAYCGKGIPDINTKVYSYLQWIDDTKWEFEASHTNDESNDII